MRFEGVIIFVWSEADCLVVPQPVEAYFGLQGLLVLCLVGFAFSYPVGPCSNPDLGCGLVGSDVWLSYLCCCKLLLIVMQFFQSY